MRSPENRYFAWARPRLRHDFRASHIGTKWEHFPKKVLLNAAGSEYAIAMFSPRCFWGICEPQLFPIVARWDYGNSPPPLSELFSP